MAYHNLAVYDFELLFNIDRSIKVSFYTNEKFNIAIPHMEIKKIYHYSDKKGLFKIISYLKSQIILLHEIKKSKPDIVHFQWLKLPPVDYWFVDSLHDLLEKILERPEDVIEPVGEEIWS